MSREPAQSPVKSITEGLGKLLNGNPNDNVDGIRDIASGVIQATSISAAALDNYLQKRGLSLPQLSLPGISGQLLDHYLKPENMALHMVSAGVRRAMTESPKEEEAERHRAEAEKEEQRAKEFERQRRIAANDLALERFKNGDGSKSQRESHSVPKEPSRARVNLV